MSIEGQSHGSCPGTWTTDPRLDSPTRRGRGRSLSGPPCDEWQSVWRGETLSSSYTFVLTPVTRFINHAVWLPSSGGGGSGAARKSWSVDDDVTAFIFHCRYRGGCIRLLHLPSRLEEDFSSLTAAFWCLYIKSSSTVVRSGADF